MATYRSNVAAILRDPATGRIFIGERVDHPGSWQFPQGGVDSGEDLITALYREVEEEIGVRRGLYDLVACRSGYRYKFPKGKLKKGKYCGQNQTYFLCDFKGCDEDINLLTHEQEFSRFRWIEPPEFDLAWVPRFKRPVFVRVFRDFFGIERLIKTPKKLGKTTKKAAKKAGKSAAPRSPGLSTESGRISELTVAGLPG